MWGVLCRYCFVCIHSTTLIQSMVLQVMNKCPDHGKFTVLLSNVLKFFSVADLLLVSARSSFRHQMAFGYTQHSITGLRSLTLTHTLTHTLVVILNTLYQQLHLTSFWWANKIHAHISHIKWSGLFRYDLTHVQIT